MSSPQADKAGLHILLKLAALVIILAGIHAAADILVQLLLALFFAIVLNPLVTWFIRRGVRRPFAITQVVTAMLVMLTRKTRTADPILQHCKYCRQKLL